MCDSELFDHVFKTQKSNPIIHVYELANLFNCRHSKTHLFDFVCQYFEWPNSISHPRQNVLISPLVCVKIDFSLKSRFQFICPRDATRGSENADIPPTASATSCYGAETLRGIFLRYTENLRLLIVFCLGPFWYTLQLFFRLALPSHISHGTDTILTRYDTGRTEIAFGPFDVCIWVSPFLGQDSPIEGTPHQCPFCGIFAEPLD
jgi:hypothetical protein